MADPITIAILGASAIASAWGGTYTGSKSEYNKDHSSEESHKKAVKTANSVINTGVRYASMINFAGTVIDNATGDNPSRNK